jgi:hypothetical protein
MSLGQWSWRGGFAEIDCPLPISDLGHLLKVLANVVVMFIEFSADHLDCVGSLHAKPRDMLQCIEHKMEAAHFVEHDHVERCGCRTLVDIIMPAEASFMRATVNQGVNEPSIVVEGEDHGRTFSEERVEEHLVHPVQMFVWIHQSFNDSTGLMEWTEPRFGESESALSRDAGD